MYLRGAQVSTKDEATVIARTMHPYFNRTHNHFMSHKHAPSTGETIYPAVIEYHNVVYFAHPIFSQYQYNATRWTRTMLNNTLHHLLGKSLISHNGPSTLQVTLNRQQIDGNERWIVHLLHYIPIRRSDHIDVIEDVIPLYDIDLRIQITQPVRGARLVPEDISLNIEQSDGEIRLTVDHLHGHQMIELTL